MLTFSGAHSNWYVLF